MSVLVSVSSGVWLLIFSIRVSQLAQNGSRWMTAWPARAS